MGKDSAGWIVAVGGSKSQEPLMEAAKKDGFRIIGLDRNPNNPLFDIAVPISTHEVEEAVRKINLLSSDHKISGVVL